MEQCMLCGERYSGAERHECSPEAKRRTDERIEAATKAREARNKAMVFAVRALRFYAREHGTPSLAQQALEIMRQAGIEQAVSDS